MAGQVAHIVSWKVRSDCIEEMYGEGPRFRRSKIFRNVLESKVWAFWARLDWVRQWSNSKPREHGNEPWCSITDPQLSTRPSTLSISRTTCTAKLESWSEHFVWNKPLFVFCKFNIKLSRNTTLVHHLFFPYAYAPRTQRITRNLFNQIIKTSWIHRYRTYRSQAQAFFRENICKQFSQSYRASWYYQSFFIYQLMHKRIALQRILKFTLKQLQHILVQSPSSGSVLFEHMQLHHQINDTGVF
jgi:hypothetical protein